MSAAPAYPKLQAAGPLLTQTVEEVRQRLALSLPSA
jgi:hypothetical protein